MKRRTRRRLVIGAWYALGAGCLFCAYVLFMTAGLYTPSCDGHPGCREVLHRWATEALVAFALGVAALAVAVWKHLRPHA